MFRVAAALRTTVAMLSLSVPVEQANAQPAPHVVAQCQGAHAGTLSLAEVVRRSGGAGSPPVIFDCPANTVIRMDPRQHIEIRGKVIIDGENRITLEGRPISHISAHRSEPMFVVPGGVGASLVLKNIRIRGAIPRELAGSSVVHSEEHLVLENVTIEDSDTPIRAARDLTVRDSHFNRNRKNVLLGRGAVGDIGAILIERSRFVGNPDSSVLGGGSTTIIDSQFIGGNSAVLLQAGSVKNSLFQSNHTGVFAGITSTAEIAGNTFDRNVTGLVVLSARQGTATSLKVLRNVFSGQTNGGMLVSQFGTTEPPAGSHISLEVSYNRFVRNKSQGHGGALNVALGPMAPHSRMNLKGNVFFENVADVNGGAIHWAGGVFGLSESLLRGNRAGGAGGAIYSRTPPDSVFTIANALIVENAGGAAIDVSTASILNVTIAKNKGHGITFAGQPGSNAVIANTIFDQNGEGNCGGVPASLLRRGNLQFGFADCPGVPVINPNLDSLYVPAVGSEAAGAGDGAICGGDLVGGVDVMYQKRGGGACSSGAYERPPVRIAREKRTRVKVCPDGSKLPLKAQCPEELKICVGGQSIPVSLTCPCQERGQVCRTASDCCGGDTCTGGRCAERQQVCVGGQTIPVSATCPCQPRGQVCRSSADCCNGDPCTNGRCSEPTKVCPGGARVPVSAPCPCIRDGQSCRASSECCSRDCSHERSSSQRFCFRGPN